MTNSHRYVRDKCRRLRGGGVYSFTYFCSHFHLSMCDTCYNVLYIHVGLLVAPVFSVRLVMAVQVNVPHNPLLTVVIVANITINTIQNYRINVYYN